MLPDQNDQKRLEELLGNLFEETTDETDEPDDIWILDPVRPPRIIYSCCTYSYGNLN